MAVYTKKWNGSAWVTAPVKKWNGSAWVDAYVRKWNGSSWVQIYPETVVTTSKTLSAAASSMNTYRSKWDGYGVAKQGVYSSYAAAHGYLAVAGNGLPGSGSISSIGSATFSGTRDGSGYYNNDQTVRFHRSNIAPASSSPVNTMSGQFTATTGAPGSGKGMSNRAISVNSETVNWANCVSGKPYLYIYSSSSSDYMGINGTFSIAINNYSYQAKTLTFDGPQSKGILMSPAVYKDTTGLDPYYHMVVYEEEMDMTLDEIMKRRENGIVDDISASDIDHAPEIKAWTREYEVCEIETDEGYSEQAFRIEVNNMCMSDVPEFSLDGVTWKQMIARPDEYETSYVTGILPKDFNKFTDFIYFRVYDKDNDIVYSERSIEPKIYIPDQTGAIILPGSDIDISTILTEDEIKKYNK